MHKCSKKNLFRFFVLLHIKYKNVSKDLEQKLKYLEVDARENLIHDLQNIKI